jgi:hypothetical protein
MQDIPTKIIPGLKVGTEGKELLEDGRAIGSIFILLTG